LKNTNENRSNERFFFCGKLGRTIGQTKLDDADIVPYDLRNINKQKMLSITNRQQTKIKTGG